MNRRLTTTATLVVLAVLNVVAYAQSPKATTKANQKSTVKKADAEQLRNFDTLRGMYVFQKTAWDLAIKYQSEDEQYAAKLGDAIAAKIMSGEVPDVKKAYVKKYALTLAGVVLALGTLGDSLGYYYPLGDDIPLDLALYEGKKCVMVSVGTSSVYNTLRISTSKQRVAKVITDLVLPELEDLHEALESTDIEYVAPFITYGTRDFSEKDSPSNIESEMLAIVVSKKDAKRFADAQITDQELVDRSVVLVAEAHSLDFKRIKVSLE